MSNFAKIPDFCNMLTVGGGRGIRFNLFLQDFAQLDSKYDEKEAKTIRANCETWVYLKSNDNGTNEEISKRLGKYTTTAYSLSQNAGKFSAPTSGSSVNLVGRELLMPDEVARIKRPEALIITAGNLPAVTRLPDLSKWTHNDMLGLGDPKHNAAVIAARAVSRPERPPSKPVLWGIWERMSEDADADEDSFDALRNRVRKEMNPDGDPRVAAINAIPGDGEIDFSDEYLTDAIPGEDDI